MSAVYVRPSQKIKACGFEKDSPFGLPREKGTLTERLVDAYRIMEAYSNGEDIDEYVLRNKFKTVTKRKIEEDVLPESFERNNETSPGI